MQLDNEWKQTDTQTRIHILEYAVAIPSVQTHPKSFFFTIMIVFTNVKTNAHRLNMADLRSALRSDRTCSVISFFSGSAHVRNLERDA